MTPIAPGDRLASRLESTTRLDLREATAAIVRLCAVESRRRGREYRVHVQGDAVLVGYRASPAAPIPGSRRNRSELLAGHWLVAVRFPSSDGARRQRPVEMRLTNWVMDSEGRREPRGRYERLTRAIWATVTS